mmetsp:Transcript_191/g.230  ORF Transcript_191/g.230 Transcript_191/m.230 type:complete len:439 (-) Transcript_191:11-1327(-)
MLSSSARRAAFRQNAHTKSFHVVPSMMTGSSCSSFSTSRDFSTNNINENTQTQQGGGEEKPRQEFVRHKFKQHRPKMISREDFANRPKVGFSTQFESLHEAGVVLSWMGEEQRQAIYQMYLDTMEHMYKSEKNNVTSHEYVVHVIANKFNIDVDRVAAIIQSLHNEDQVRAKDPEREIHYDLQEYVDRKAFEHIKNAYAEYGEEGFGDQFVEDPTPFVSDTGKRAKVMEVSDLVDIDQLVYEAAKKEREYARLQIANKIYIEDVDDTYVNVKLNKDANDLLKRQKSMMKEVAEAGIQSTDDRPPKSRFIAKIINTEERKKAKGKKGYKLTKRQQKIAKKQTMHNTLTSENAGELRASTVAEANRVSWKPERNGLEFLYRGVKQAWLNKVLRGEEGGWGRIEAQPKKEVVEKEISIGGEPEVSAGDENADTDSETKKTE